MLFALAIGFFTTGGKSLVPIDAKALIPDFTKLNTLVVFVSFILAYAGIEASATHANEMKNVKKDYPLAIIMVILCDYPQYDRRNIYCGSRTGKPAWPPRALFRALKALCTTLERVWTGL